MRPVLSVVPALLPFSILSFAQQLGVPPPLDVEPVDVYTVYHLPPLRDSPKDPLGKALAELQLGVRARKLGLNSMSATDTWDGIHSVAELSRGSGAPPSSGEIRFDGERASDLNKILSGASAKRVRVTSGALTVDEPIVIGHSGTVLDLGSAVIRGTSQIPYLVRIEKARKTELRGGVFAAGDTAILVSNSEDVRISGVTIRDLAGAGIVATQSTRVAIRDNRITGLKYAGVILHRGVTGSLVEENRIENNIGTPNVAAGIVLTDREVDITGNSRAIFGPGGYWVLEQVLAERMNPPAGNLIRANQVLHNRAGGIYSDGGVKNVISSNTIVGNGKEGICLDNASVANVVTGNVIRRNGSRWGEPDKVLAMESVAAGGRLADGTPASKVPGVSLDNALYNIVFNNEIAYNYGGGIKFVRTGFFNLIGLNTLIDDSLGTSNRFHYFGIELGAAPPDVPTKELDLTPSRGNIIFSNLIRGLHYAGIFFGDGSDRNNVFDNVIMDATDWGIESVRPMQNNVLNNLTNIRSRNTGSGIDPALLVIGKPVIDAQFAEP